MKLKLKMKRKKLKMTKNSYLIIVLFIIIGILTAFTWSLQQAYFGPTWLFVFKHLFVFFLVAIPIYIISKYKRL